MHCEVCFNDFEGDTCPICKTKVCDVRESIRIYTSTFCGSVKCGIEDSMAHDIAVHEVIKFHAKEYREKKHDHRILNTSPARWKHVL